MTSTQSVLLSWLRYYDWLLSGKGPKVPDQEIIDDDEALDDYVDGWKRDMEKREAEAAKGSKGSGKKSFNVG